MADRAYGAQRRQPFVESCGERRGAVSYFLFYFLLKQVFLAKCRKTERGACRAAGSYPSLLICPHFLPLSSTTRYNNPMCASVIPAVPFVTFAHSRGQRCTVRHWCLQLVCVSRCAPQAAAVTVIGTRPRSLHEDVHEVVHELHIQMCKAAS